MIRLVKFRREHYANLISWMDSEETLMQVAGTTLKFPLTEEQLDISLSDKDRHSFAGINNETGNIIGHAEIYLSNSAAKFGRIIIGDETQRGKGFGEQVVKQLLIIAFDIFNKTEAELNVFDWNKSAIKCYEKVGFVINPNKIFERKIKNETWIALNMVINKQHWNFINKK